MIKLSEYHYVQRETPSCQRIKVGRYELWYWDTETVVIKAAGCAGGEMINTILKGKRGEV